jgi:hypothetical protein
MVACLLSGMEHLPKEHYAATCRVLRSRSVLLGQVSPAYARAALLAEA